MAPVRIAWILLAGLIFNFASIAVFVASIPEYRYTSCEVFGGGAGCMESASSRGGYEIVAVLVFAVVLCLIPALLPRRVVAWVVAVALLGSGLVLVGAIGNGGIGFVFVAIAAVALASLHRRLASGGRARGEADSMSVRDS